MKHSMYAKRDVTKYYFTLPNQIFDLGLHYIEVAIYAYLLRIENRKTFECIASYPKIAKALGLSVNTVAKYVANLNVDVVDLGVPVLSMHAPYEIVSKADVYSTYRACFEFFRS